MRGVGEDKTERSALKVEGGDRGRRAVQLNEAGGDRNGSRMRQVYGEKQEGIGRKCWEKKRKDAL